MVAVKNDWKGVKNKSEKMAGVTPFLVLGNTPQHKKILFINHLNLSVNPHLN